ncbi:MAG: helix-turn-helix domain-containing protein [Candidatus Promineifilaceae bacterium]
MISKAELIIHPIRLRIVRTLLFGPQTTQELAEQLPDVPKSSLYRHLRLLLEGEMIGIAEARLVQGIQEKVYELVQMPHLSRQEFAELSAEEHLRYFTTFMAILLQGFADYLAANPDFQSDLVGYNEIAVWATPEDFDRFNQKLGAAILPLMRQEKGNGRHQYKLATVVYPIPESAKTE